MTTARLAIVAFLPFVVWSRRFDSPFFIPKLIVGAALGATSWWWLAGLRRVRLPGGARLAGLMVGLAWLAVAGVRGPWWVPTSSALAVLLMCLGAWLAVLNLPERLQHSACWGVVAAAILEALIGIAESFGRVPFLARFGDRQNPGVIATVGNQEFLATLLACGIFGLLHGRAHLRHPAIRSLSLVALVPLVIGIALTRSKGTAVILLVWGIWRWTGSVRFLMAGGAIGAATLLWFFPDSIKGRLLLWLAAAQVFAEHPVAGVGLGQFGNHYLAAIDHLFLRFPGVQAALGSYTADVRDAHNILLEGAVSLGIPGALLAGWLCVALFRVAFRETTAIGGALWLLLLKLQYTVVLASLTGGLLLTLFAALATSFRTRHNPRSTRLTAAALGLIPLIVTFAASVDDCQRSQGMRQLFLGNRAGALAAFHGALRADATDGFSRLGVAMVRWKEGDLVAMDESIRQAMADNQTVDVIKKSAHLYFFSGRHGQAEPIYEFLARVYPNRRSAFIKLAQIRQARGDLRGARRLARLVIAMHPRVRNPNDSGYLATARAILNTSRTDSRWRVPQ